jgi:hypothetical protein
MIKPFRRWHVGAVVIPAVLLGSAAVSIAGSVPAGPTPGVPKKLVTVNETVGTKSTALCPAGTVATGGGGHASDTHGAFRPPLTKTEPEYKDVPGTGKIPIGWRVEVAANKSAGKVRALVNCEDAGITPAPTTATPGSPKKLVTVTETNGTKATALCPAGTVATGGGGHASGVKGSSRPPITKTEPEYKDVPGVGKIPVGWRIEVAGNKTGDKIRALVVCEDAGVTPAPTTATPGVPKKLVTVNEVTGTKASAVCPAGTVATGGGGHASGVHGIARPPLTKSEAEYKDVPGVGKIAVGWRVEIGANKATDKVRALAICEDAAA